jgi:hypothetical protein
MSKKCIICGIEKEIDCFSKHRGMKDGHLNKCKSCACDYSHKWYRSTIEDRVAFEKNRSQTIEFKKRHINATRKLRAVGDLRLIARNAVSNAVRDGKLIKQPCKRCGNIKTQAHHDDYTKPLDVEWLCRDCHMEEHGKKTYVSRIDNTFKQDEAACGQ